MSEKLGELLWSEDECLRHDPDAEHVNAAFKRLSGLELSEQTKLREVDLGDCHAQFYKDGWIVLRSHDGAHIYRIGGMNGLQQ